MKAQFFLLPSAKNRLPAQKSLIRHVYKRPLRKGSCLSGVCAKRHTDFIALPTYTVRRTHAHRTLYACTPYAVRAYTERRTCSSEPEAATKRAGSVCVKRLETYTSGHSGTTSHPRSLSVKITMQRAAGRADCRVKMRQQMLMGRFVSFSFSF